MTEEQKSPGVPEDVAQRAVNETGFGRFNLKIMAVCALIYMNMGFGYGSLGLVIPAAACDFEMTSIDKGRLSVSSSLGMVCGAYVWGCLADVKGRKYALIVAVLLHGVFDCISAVTLNYWLFTSTKFFSGLGLSGELALIFAYLGEFQPTNVRDRILSWMEMAWVVGYTAVPIIGWMVIPLEFQYPMWYFSFRSWNLFLLICSFPSIMIAIWLTFLPETPKYLAESEQYTELLKVLETMYADNNQKQRVEYTEKISKLGDSTLNELIRLAGTTGGASKRTRTSKEIFSSFFTQTLMLVKPPYLSRTLIVVTVTTCLMGTYFPLIMWLPEVFNRFAAFEALYPDEYASVCTVSVALHHNTTDDLTPVTFQSTSSPICDAGVNEDVYLHTIILGLACLPTALWLPLFVERLGYVFHLVIGSFVCGAVIVGLFFTTSSVENLVLSCVFESVASIAITSMLCMLVELYPTNLRVMAAAFTTFIGRLGSFLGNAMFGYLIDDYCVPLISFIAAQLFLGGLLSLLIPRNSKQPQQQ